MKYYDNSFNGWGGNWRYLDEIGWGKRNSANFLEVFNTSIKKFEQEGEFPPQQSTNQLSYKSRNVSLKIYFIITFWHLELSLRKCFRQTSLDQYKQRKEEQKNNATLFLKKKYWKKPIKVSQIN
jgi:hypothetical protein